MFVFPHGSRRELDLARLTASQYQTPTKASSFKKLDAVVEGEETPAGAASPRHGDAASPSATRTPTSSTPIQPSTQEMHPRLYHSAVKKSAAEQRFGFDHQSGAPPSQHTPVKQTSDIPRVAAPPTEPSTQATADDQPTSPSFAFTFRHPSVELSNEAQKIMESVRGEAEHIRRQLATQRQQQMEKDGSADALFGGRRIAMPKGKLGRYSDVHVEQFKKMESIANHPSAFRAALDRSPHKSGLKRSTSKAELDTLDGTPTHDLKRTSSKASLIATPKSSKASIKVVGPAAPAQGPSKRRKTMLESQAAAESAAASASTTPSTSTKSAATAPLSATHAASKIPALKHHPSTTSLKPPSTPTRPSSIAAPQTEPPARVPARKTFASKLSNVKSILRKPHIKFSDDPFKQAAGTHVSPAQRVVTPSRTVPHGTTTPANRTEKHVNFTPEPAHIIPRAPDTATHDAPPSSPSPVKVAPLHNMADAATPTRRVSYPRLAPPPASAPPKPAGDFTFRSASQLAFAPAPPTHLPDPGAARPAPRAILRPSTIRKVRPSLPSTPHVPRSKMIAGVPHGLSNKKRKRETGDGGEGAGEGAGAEKENTPRTAAAARPAKKARVESSPLTAKSTPAKGTVARSGVDDGRALTPKRFMTPTKSRAAASATKSATPCGSTPGKKLSWARLERLALPKKR